MLFYLQRGTTCDCLLPCITKLYLERQEFASGGADFFLEELTPLGWAAKMKRVASFECIQLS